MTAGSRCVGAPRQADVESIEAPLVMSAVVEAFEGLFEGLSRIAAPAEAAFATLAETEAFHVQR